MMRLLGFRHSRQTPKVDLSTFANHPAQLNVFLVSPMRPVTHHGFSEALCGL